jgi:hypothetical protein
MTNSLPMLGPVPALPSDVLTSWHAFIVVIVPIIIAALKKGWPSTPKAVWPILATALGAGADWLFGRVGVLAQSSLALGAICGAAGVGLREITTQLLALAGSHGGSASAPPSPPVAKPT